MSLLRGLSSQNLQKIEEELLTSKHTIECGCILKLPQ